MSAGRGLSGELRSEQQAETPSPIFDHSRISLRSIRATPAPGAERAADEIAFQFSRIDSTNHPFAMSAAGAAFSGEWKIGGSRSLRCNFPDFAALHPGYAC